MLVPTVILLQITLRFRGGRVWTVWATLLAGVLSSAAGDVLFADPTEHTQKLVGPLVDLLFIYGYWFSALGAKRQYELMS
jgi:hypothetical protein